MSTQFQLEFLDRIFADENFYQSCFQWHHPLGNSTLEPDWLVEGFLPSDYLMLLTSKTKEGKSSFLTALMLAVLKGEPFAGLPTRQGGVLWISGDENFTERTQVLKHSELARNENLPLLYNTHDLPHIEHPKFTQAIHWGLAQANVRLIIVDSLYAQTRSDLEKHRNARKVMTTLKTIANNGVAVIVLHQERGNDGIQLHATASISAKLHAVRTRHGRLIRLQCRGRGDFANKIWTFRSETPTDYHLLTAATQEESQYTETEVMIMDALKEQELTFGQLVRTTELNRNTIKSALRAMLEDGLIDFKGKEPRLYSLPQPENLTPNTKHPSNPQFCRDEPHFTPSPHHPSPQLVGGGAT